MLTLGKLISVSNRKPNRGQIKERKEFGQHPAILIGQQQNAYSN